MAIWKALTGVSSSKAKYYFSSSATDSNDAIDFAYGFASDNTYSNEYIYQEVYDEAGNVVTAPVLVNHHTIPTTDPNTGAIFDNHYNSFALTDALHGVVYTQSTSTDYNTNDETSIKFQRYDASGNAQGAALTLKFGGQAGIKDLYEVHEGAVADFGNSFVETYSTYDPSTKQAQISYGRFSDDGTAISSGLLRSFSDGTHHGLSFGSFYAANNPNDGGTPDYLLLNRAAGSNAVQAELLGVDMKTVLASTTITDTGPAGEASTAVDKYGFLSPGTGAKDNFGVLSQTFRYTDASGVTHEEIALEKVDPKTLKVSATTEFEDLQGSQTGVSMQHLSNGNILALYNDGGQSYIKEFNGSLLQVGAAFALPKDNDGYDNFVALGNDKFEVFWRQHTTADTSSPTVQHHAIYQA